MSDPDLVLRRIKLSDLRLLQAVAEWGAMAKAAAHLNMSQPAISKAIGTLEHALGVRLLDRTPKGVELTVFGETLLSGGVAVFDELKQSLNRIELLSDPNAGQIRIGCSEAGAAGIVPAVIERFSRQRPRVAFHVVTADPVTLVERDLVQRTVDLVICAIPRVKSEQAFEVVHLYDDRHVVMASRHSKWARRRKISLADLAEDAWVLPPLETEPGRLIASAFRELGMALPGRLVTAFSIPLALHLLATGDYVAILPKVMAQLSSHLHLKVLPVALPDIRRSIGIVTLRSRSAGPLTKNFIDCARDLAAGLHR